MRDIDVFARYSNLSFPEQLISAVPLIFWEEENHVSILGSNPVSNRIEV